jgi:hypothetical protein
VQIELNSISTDNVTEVSAFNIPLTNDKELQNDASNSLIFGNFLSLHISKNSEYNKEIKSKYRNIPLVETIFVQPYINKIRTVKTNNNTRKNSQFKVYEC